MDDSNSVMSVSEKTALGNRVTENLSHKSTMSLVEGHGTPIPGSDWRKDVAPDLPDGTPAVIHYVDVPDGEYFVLLSGCESDDGIDPDDTCTMQVVHDTGNNEDLECLLRDFHGFWDNRVAIAKLFDFVSDLADTASMGQVKGFLMLLGFESCFS